MSLMPVCEIWTPRSDGAVLELKQGSYGGYESFQQASRGTVFAPGQGLPGNVWKSGLPVVWSALDAPDGFFRARAAAESGLSAGLGFPIMDGDEVKAVMVFLYVQGREPTGVMEVWAPDKAQAMLTWQSGFYGALHDIKEESMKATFARGQGLPGTVWESKIPQLFPDLWQFSGFVREEAAAITGLTMGLGLPVLHANEVRAVAVLLSSDFLPFAKIFEIWVPNASGSALVRHAGYYGRLSVFDRDAEASLSFAPGEGLPGRVWATKMPALLEPLDDASSGFARYRAAAEADLSVGIGLPILQAGQVRAVVVLLN